MINEKYCFIDGILKINIADKWEEVELPGYNFLDIIGTGANGVVVKAQHQITERIDAIKVWTPHKRSKDGKVNKEQYFKEVRKVSNFKHDNIVTIYDAKIYSDEVFICSMEYIEGEPLKIWCNNDHSIYERINICKEILNTVEKYQEGGIVHGDLHGGNIIIDKQSHIHIIDFGTSLYGHENQSKERESYFLFDLVKKIFIDDFKENFFSIKNYNIKSKIENNNDTRKYEPLLITRTLLQYVKLVEIKKDTVEMTDNQILIEYCEYIAKGIYFNLYNVYEDLLRWSSKFIREMSYEVLYENIYCTIFPEDGNQFEEIRLITLYIYYEIFINCEKNINFDESKKKYFSRHKGYLTMDMYDLYLSDIKHYESQTYLEYKPHLLNLHLEQDVYDKEDTLRSILSDLIENHFKERFIFILYIIWRRLNEIKIDKVLYSRIVRSTND